MSIKRLIVLFCYGAAAALVFRLFVFEGVYVATPSMEPTLVVGRSLFLDKVTFLFRDPQRGEIIAFKAPIFPYKEMIKRVVALPGDTVELKKKKLYVNGEPVAEPYVQYTRAEERLRGDDLGPLKVPADHLFVLGDNRDQSNDSAAWRDEAGRPVYFLPMSRVRGRLRGVY